MSERLIIIIPELPDLVPDREKQWQTISYLQSILPPGTGYKVTVTAKTKLVDCGSDFTFVNCPSCGADIRIRTWQGWLSEDSDAEGVILNQHRMPCCGNLHNLNDLKYREHQGFARFQIIAMNAGIDELSEEQLAEFSRLLGCPVRAVYRRL
jgi:hypothetical protein